MPKATVPGADVIKTSSGFVQNGEHDFAVDRTNRTNFRLTVLAQVSKMN